MLIFIIAVKSFKQNICKSIQYNNSNLVFSIFKKRSLCCDAVDLLLWSGGSSCRWVCLLLIRDHVSRFVILLTANKSTQKDQHRIWFFCCLYLFSWHCFGETDIFHRFWKFCFLKLAFCAHKGQIIIILLNEWSNHYIGSSTIHIVVHELVI